MAYTVLARKYRSQTFDDVVGQDAVVHTLKNAIQSGRVAHAYLFCGTRGVGKTTVARVLAKALNCLAASEPTATPCCKCNSCLAINTGEDIDVPEIDGASNNGVDQVRELRENAIYRPARSRFKIYIIDEVHMLTVAAFNALLKILEEPPPHVKFIFATTEPNKVIPTIQSRCQRYDFRNISSANIARQLKAILKDEGIPFQDDLVLAVAKMANGSMRDGLSLLDRLISVGVQPLSLDLMEEYLGQPNWDKVCALIGEIAAANAGQALKAVDDLVCSGLSEIQVVDALIDALRDLMVLKTAGSQSELVILSADQMKKAQDMAGRFDIAALIYMIAALEKIRWAVKNSDSPRTLLEASVLRFALSEHFVNVDTLLSRLQGQAHVDRPVLAAPKKKQLTDVPDAPQVQDRPSDAQVEVGDSHPVVTCTPAAVDLGQIRERWQDMLKVLGDKLSPMLAKASPAGFEAGVLTIHFEPSAKVQKQMCESNGRAEQIQVKIGEFLGVPVRVAFEMDAELQAASESHADDYQIKKRRHQDLLNDQAVKAVIMGLNATITNVEEQ